MFKRIREVTHVMSNWQSSFEGGPHIVSIGCTFLLLNHTSGPCTEKKIWTEFNWLKVAVGEVAPSCKRVQGQYPKTFLKNYIHSNLQTILLADDAHMPQLSRKKTEYMLGVDHVKNSLNTALSYHIEHNPEACCQQGSVKNCTEAVATDDILWSTRWDDM